jgi:putative ABC transport system ATP-binding protein
LSTPLEPPAVEAVGVSRAYDRDDNQGLRVLDNVSLTVLPGEVVAIMGPSGSGKSTLLFLVGGLDQPTEGTVRVTGTSWSDLERDERARFRRHKCGFVVQGMTLLPQATAAENVEVPLLLDGMPAADRASRVHAALDRVGLAADGAKLPDQLSGGQQQRVAIARALVNEPAVVLADEPTGNLDRASGQNVARLLVSASVERGAAVVLVTHDPEIAAHADRVLHLRSGRLDRVTTGPIQ